MASEEAGKLRAIKVRGYRRRDRADVLEIAVRSFGGVSLDENIEKQFGKISDSWQQLKRDAVDYDLAGNPEFALVAEVGGRVVGFACNRLYRHRSVGHVTNVAVAPEFQGKGVGKALIEASLVRLREKGARYVRIETLEQNVKGLNFYPSLGFKEVGRQVYFFKEL